MKKMHARYRAILLILAMALNWPASAQQPAFLTNGLVAYFPFNGSANDESGNGRHGTVVGAALTTNRFGQAQSAYSFAGSQYIRLPQTLAWRNAPGITFSAWVQFKRVGNGWCCNTLMDLTDGECDNCWSQRMGFSQGLANYDIGFGYANGMGNVNTSSDGGATTLDYPGTGWVHVVGTVTGGMATLYINGAPKASKPVNKPAPISLDPGGENSKLIGSRSVTVGESMLNGQVDDVRIYVRGMSASEVAALYDYEKTSEHPSPRLATATPQVVNGFVVGAIVTDGGSGYTNAPAVRFVGGTGSGAAGFATLDGGAVSRVTITNPGIGYTVPPTIEIDPPPYPPIQAKGVAAVVNGFVTGITVTDGGHGYSDTPPPVHLLGGGGAGAKAVATVANGVVTGITITNPGRTYTNTPTVLIAAPPGFPRLSIQMHSVRVSLELMPGYNYKIQTTKDGGTNWSDTGESFLAEQNTYTRVFEVIGTSQLFRVVQVP